MDGPRTKTRARIDIDGREFLVDDDRDLVDLMGRIEAAARSEATFVDISSRTGLVSVLISPGAHVVVSVEHEQPSGWRDDAPVTQMPDWEL